MAKAKEPKAQLSEEEKFELFEAAFASFLIHAKTETDIVVAVRKAKRAVEIANQELFK